MVNKTYNDLLAVTDPELASAMTRLACRYRLTDGSFAYALLARAAVLGYPMAMSIMALLMKRRTKGCPKEHRGRCYAWWLWAVVMLLHNIKYKVASALLKRVPQEQVEDIRERKFRSDGSCLAVEKVARQIETFYRATRRDAANIVRVQQAMDYCLKLYERCEGAEFYGSGPDDEERDVLKRIGISVKRHKKRKVNAAKNDKSEILHAVDDEMMKQGAEKVGEKNGYSLYVLRMKIVVVTAFDKCGIWFAKKSAYPYWSSRDEQVSSPIRAISTFVSSLRKQLPYAEVIGIVAVHPECDIVEMDQGCVDEWSRQGLFCTVISEASFFNKSSALRDFLLARTSGAAGGKWDQDVLSAELREVAGGFAC